KGLASACRLLNASATTTAGKSTSKARSGEARLFASPSHRNGIRKEYEATLRLPSTALTQVQGIPDNGVNQGFQVQAKVLTIPLCLFSVSCRSSPGFNSSCVLKPFTPFIFFAC